MDVDNTASPFRLLRRRTTIDDDNHFLFRENNHMNENQTMEAVHSKHSDDEEEHAHRRSRSLHEGEGGQSSSTSLNASFDMALLQASTQRSSSLHAHSIRTTASWDNGEDAAEHGSRSQTPLAWQSPVGSHRKPTKAGGHHKASKLTPAALKRRRPPATVRRSPMRPRPLKATVSSPWKHWDEDRPVRKGKTSFGTAATAASTVCCLESTLDSSGCTETDRTLCFASFPASLPRIPPRSAPRHAEHHYHHHNHAHNTSLSSLDDQSEEDSLLGTPVARTRLNFMMSPGAAAPRVPWTNHRPSNPSGFNSMLDKADFLSSPYEPKRVNSFASSVSSLKNQSTDEVATQSTAALTPSRGSNDSPHEVQLNHFSAPCSPILGLDEDTESSQGRLSNDSRPLPDMTAFDGNAMDTTEQQQHHQPPQQLLLQCPPTPVRTPAWANDAFKATRSNSLIATKVLAMGTIRSVLDETDTSTSLEGEDLDAMDPADATTSSPGLYTATPFSLQSAFDVDSILGRGAFADVYKARSKLDGRWYAVKRNRRQFRGRKDREGALSEVLSMQQLAIDGRSPYLLAFYRAWQEEGYFYCQVELCCRDTLRQLMDALQENDSAAPNSTISKICHNVASGLEHMHKHGWVHNDVKPSNVLFCLADNQTVICKLGDFGLTRRAGSHDDGEGDPVYMAPEVLNGQKCHASDMFSLGLVLYELASSSSKSPSLPAQGPRWHALRQAQVDWQSLHATDRGPLIPLVQALMHPQPTQRLSASSLLAHTCIQDSDDWLATFLQRDSDNNTTVTTLPPPSDNVTPRTVRKVTTFRRAPLVPPLLDHSCPL